jgi:hypothetical protein
MKMTDILPRVNDLFLPSWTSPFCILQQTHTTAIKLGRVTFNILIEKRGVSAA